MLKNAFSDITIVNVEGRFIDNISTQMALLHSQSKLPGSKALLISSHEPKITLGDFNFVKIDSLNYFEYSLFILYKLHNFINTKYALIVQDDGWIINEKAWSDDFLAYDYIGAPTHLARRKFIDNFQFFKNYSWAQDYLISPSSFEIVMNGGFSLRSKKLLELPQLRSINVVITQPLPEFKLNLQWSDDPLLEDVQICLHLREELESYGVRFPDMNLAKHFSIEHFDPIFHQNLNLMRIFGHHSKFRKITSINPLTIEYQISEAFISKLPGEVLILEMFKRLGYRIKFLN